MNITPDLAAKVLDADLRNIVKKVSDGGILSSSERQLLQNAAFPESQAKAKRAAVLALKYATGGRLSAAELAEVRELQPDFAPGLTGSPDAESADARGGEVLTLTGDDAEVSKAQLHRWGETYGVEHRQLRRWIARGKERHDPCPLDEPAKMPAWIETHLEKKRASLVEKVAAAAERARTVEPPAPSPPAASTAGETPPAPPATVPADSAKPGVGGLMIAPLDLSKVGGIEGQLYEFQSKAVAAIQQQLADAYGSGDDLRIGKLHARLDKAGEQLRKYEVAAEKKAIRVGEYLPKSEVFNDVMQALSALALMREQRKKRVRAELAGTSILGAILTALAEAGVDQPTTERFIARVGDLEPSLYERIDAALDRTGAAEESVLRNLAQLKAPADVLLALAA